MDHYHGLIFANLQAFTAVVKDGLLHRWPRKKAIESAAAAGHLKHSIPGDFNLGSVNEVQHLAATGDSGGVQR
jgi:2-dehydro-3-deoxygluconokinase